MSEYAYTKKNLLKIQSYFDSSVIEVKEDCVRVIGDFDSYYGKFMWGLCWLVFHSINELSVEIGHVEGDNREQGRHSLTVYLYQKGTKESYELTEEEATIIQEKIDSLISLSLDKGIKLKN